MNNGHEVGSDDIGWWKGTRKDPVFIFYEDVGGARRFRKDDLDKKLLEFYQGAKKFYNNERSVGGRTAGSAEDKSMDAWVYKLLRYIKN